MHLFKHPWKDHQFKHPWKDHQCVQYDIVRLVEMIIINYSQWWSFPRALQYHIVHIDDPFMDAWTDDPFMDAWIDAIFKITISLWWSAEKFGTLLNPGAKHWWNFWGKFNLNYSIFFPARSAGKCFTKEILLIKKFWLTLPH